ncbi:MAG: iron uptake porin, partial [Aphanizomenon sp.]
LSDKVRVKIDATGGELNENVNVFNPDFRSSGTGALSRYGRFSPIYRLADDGAGITVNVTPNDKLELSAAYFAAGRNTASSPLEQQGLFDGNNTLFGQLAFKPNKAINVGLTYAHAYRVGAEPKLFGDTGSVYANKWGSVADDRTESNNYGLQVSLQPSSKITLGGWAGYTTASTLVGTPNSAEMFYWATTLGVKDFLKEGNTLGFIFGQQPKLTGSTESGKSNFDALKAAGLESSTSYHIEGLYKIKLSDNILITPGLLLIINPENNDKNGKELVGTVRTTFSF